MNVPRFAPLVALLLLAFPAVGLQTGLAEEEPAKQGNFVQQALKGVTVGDPVVTDQLFVFPLIAAQVPEPMAVDAESDAEQLDFEEPKFARRRYDVTVNNPGGRAVLVIGGMVLEGGKRDRLVRKSVLVGPHSEVEAAALPASASSEVRRESEPFGVAEALAPTYLRKRALFGGSALTTTTFIAKWLDFREDDDDRKSLVAIAESPKLKQFCLPCHKSMSSLPQPKEGVRVIGAIGGVRGRIQGLILFANSKLFQGFFEAFLKGATYPAAAIELKAKKAGVPLPGAEDPEATIAVLADEAKALLESLDRATYRKDRMEDGEVGEAVVFRTPGGTRGRAIGLGGRVVYLAAYPHDPFESALYRAAFDLPDPELQEDPGRPGVTRLARRAGRGYRLTEAEQRLLDRLARPAPGRVGPGMSPPGPRVPRR